MLRRIGGRAWSLFKRARFEDELDEELRFHLEMETENNIARGMSLVDARNEARKNFGGVLRAKEDVRTVRGLALLDSLSQDLRYAARTLVGRLGFSVVIVLTLGLGIGANTAIFSAIYGVLLRPLPYGDGDRLVLLTQRAPEAGIDDITFSTKEIADYRKRNRTLDALVEYHTMPFILLGEGEPERVQTGVVSAEFFDVLRVEPHLGRSFLPGEDQPDAEPVLILSYDYWQRSHDGDSNIIGTYLEMNDRPHHVVGVLPPVPQFPDDNDVYMPLAACPFHSAEAFRANRRARMMLVFGRLKDGVTLEEASADLAAIADAMEREHPKVYPAWRGHDVLTTSLHDELTRRARPTFFLLLATAGFVLLIACANVANITLSRLVLRQKELSLRSAIGASRSRIVRQLLTESTVLAVAGGIVGLVLAWVGLDLIVGFAARFTPRAREISLDRFVLFFTLALSVATGLVFGALPAWFTDVAVRGARLRNTLVAAQVAGSLVLLVGAGLMLRSFFELQRVDLGFDSERVLTMLVDLNWSKYNDAETVRTFHDGLLESVSVHSGVISVGIGRTFPLAIGGVPNEERFLIPGEEKPSRVLDIHAVSPDYFRTIGVPLVEGRFFTIDDASGTPNVALVNQAAVDRYWPDASPVSTELATGADAGTIVGVVGNVRQYRLDEDAAPAAYVPISQFPLRVANLVVRTAAEPDRMADDMTAAVYAIDPEQAVAAVQTLENVRREVLAPTRLTTTLLALFAALALSITAAGLSGVVALSVSHRRNELGIRMALGATPSRVARLVLHEGIRLVAIGIAAGAVASFALGSLLTGHLFKVEPNDPVTFAAVSVVLLAAAAAACWIPARRVTRIDPLDSLRAD